MNDETISPTVIPTSATGGFTVPTTGVDGTPLSTGEQFKQLMTNPAFVNEALTPHTPAHSWVQAMNKRAAGIAPDIAGHAATLEPVAVDPGAWRIPYPHGTNPDAWSPEMAAGDRQLRGWLSAAGVDKATGDGLALLVAERLAALHGTDQSKADVEAEKVLRDVYRGAYDEKLQLANEFVQEIDDEEPGFKAFVKETGLGNDPQFVARMVGLAELRG